LLLGAMNSALELRLNEAGERVGIGIRLTVLQENEYIRRLEMKDSWLTGLLKRRRVVLKGSP